MKATDKLYNCWASIEFWFNSMFAKQDAIQVVTSDHELRIGILEHSAPYQVYSALLTQNRITLSLGLLVAGKTYIIETLEAGDDFTNVGYPGANYPFVATGTTPTVWTNGTIVTDCAASAPVATVLQNTLGTITWEYEGIGMYAALGSTLFKSNKTFVIYGILDTSNDAATAIVKYGNNTTSVIKINTIDKAALPCDWLLTKTAFEIRVYN